MEATMKVDVPGPRASLTAELFEEVKQVSASNRANTPGPWTNYPADGRRYVTGPGGVFVAAVDLAADARLIAAAPDLLRLLDEMVNGIRDVRDEARAAIARAKGEG